MSAPSWNRCLALLLALGMMTASCDSEVPTQGPPPPGPSPSFNPHPTPTPTTTAPPNDDVPTLLSPDAGASLDNGCTNGNVGIQWRFAWSRVRKASRYHLMVTNPSAKLTIIDDEFVADALYRFTSPGFIPDGNRLDWRWKVRAFVGKGFGDFSPEGTFEVEPVNTDCP